MWLFVFWIFLIVSLKNRDIFLIYLKMFEIYIKKIFNIMEIKFKIINKLFYKILKSNIKKEI